MSKGLTPGSHAPGAASKTKQGGPITVKAYRRKP
jgi:hypothetical protein